MSATNRVTTKAERAQRRHREIASHASGATVFVMTALIFLLSPVHQPADSNYSMLLSESLIRHGSFTLDRYAIPRLDPKQQNGYVSNGDIYQLQLVNDHLYYFFPPGSSILSIPYVAAMNVVGISAANPDQTYNPRGETKIEAGLAALLMAAFAATLFYTSRLLLPLRWGVLVALGGALGTQIWSTASRALWSETWGIFLLGLVIWMLVAHEAGKYRIRPILLGSLLSWIYFVRPTFSLPIIAITVYILMYHRPLFVRYAATGAWWLAGFLAYSWYHFGQAMPDYYHVNRLSFDSFWIALPGNLISPSRGLLVFVPLTIFTGYLLVRYRSELMMPGLVAVSVSVIVAHIIVVSCFVPWYGGHCYGPRYTTGLVPWFALLGILGVRAGRTWYEKHGGGSASFIRRIEFAAGGMLLACSIAMNAMGGIARSTWFWNIRPVNIDEQPERVWDWEHPQFLPASSSRLWIGPQAVEFCPFCPLSPPHRLRILKARETASRLTLICLAVSVRFLPGARISMAELLLGCEVLSVTVGNLSCLAIGVGHRFCMRNNGPCRASTHGSQLMVMSRRSAEGIRSL